MTLTFADTHNMIAYLTKSDASEGFDQIIDFLNASLIKYALTPSEECGYFYKVLYVSTIPTTDDKSTSWVGNGFSGVETHLFEGMIVAQQDDDVVDDGAIGVNVDAGKQAGSQAQIYQIDLVNADKVLSTRDDELEPSELKEVVEVVTTAKLMTKVVTATSATITAATTPINAATITTAPSATTRRKEVVIRDPEETATPSIIIHSEPKSKDKGKGIMVEEPKPLKKQSQIEQDEAYVKELEAELNKYINLDDVIKQV
nr:hypothetical protein [Tanacetum cinerariifolium]